MTEDAKQLEQELQASTESRLLAQRQEQADKEKLAKTLIDDVIAEKVFLSTYQMKQDAYFADIVADTNVIEQAYEQALPTLLTTTTFKNQIVQFLQGVDAATVITASGANAQLLADAVKAAGHTAVEMGDGSSKGTLVYTQGETRADWSVEEFVSDVKKMTISFVSEYIRKNG